MKRDRAVDHYIARAPAPARPMMRALRTAIASAVPRDAAETISYRIPAVKRERVLVWFAAFRDHCSLFPGASIVARFKEDLEPYKTSKGTIQFPIERRLPVALVKKIVRARVRDDASKDR